MIIDRDTFGDLEEIGDEPESAGRVDVMQLRHAFLQRLHPTGFSDLRAIRQGEAVKTLSVAAGDVRAVDTFAAAYFRRNIYIGVATRARINGRELADCSELYTVFADLDFKDFPSEAAARTRLQAFPLQASVIIQTGGGLHAYWFLTQPLDLRNGGAERAKQILRALANALGGDLTSAEPAHILRLPGTFNHKPVYPEPRPVTVESFDSDRSFTLDQIVSVLPPLVDEKASAAPLPQEIQDGGRNATLFKEGCRLRHLGLDYEEILAALTVINQRRCQPPLPTSEVDSIAKSCTRYEASARKFPLTETGDAECLADLYADSWRYDHRQGRDLVSDETSGIWLPDPTEQLTQMTVRMMRLRQHQALDLEGDEKQAAVKWTLRGESRSRIANARVLARSIPPVSDAGDHWDQAPFLLGTQNGVIDLSTGSFRRATHSDCVTMRVRSAYDPAAKCPLWLKTLDGIFAPGELFDELEGRRVVDFMQRAVGYSATGDCREECCFFNWGEGANGKGTFINTLGWLLAQYTDDMPYSTLERSTRSGIPNDIAKLDGKRFITCAEVNEFTLNESRLKALTGRDPITARFLHREFFTFIPVAKIWIATNNKPRIVGQDDGIWRRIHLIPFVQKFEGPTNNKALKDLLRNELPGILNWVIEGARMWLEQGLDPPKTVRAATESYRQESNPLTAFIDACCVVNDTCSVQAAHAWQAYQEFMKNVDETWRVSDKAFHKAMKSRFRHEERRQTFYLGVGLRDERANDQQHSF